MILDKGVPQSYNEGSKGGLVMRMYFYENPESVQWLGWMENCMGQVVAFVGVDGSLVWEW